MKLLLDAHATIKLHRSGMLVSVVGAFRCMIPEAVYDEIVTQAKARLHQDAYAIEVVVAGAVTIVPSGRREHPEMGLGAGELAVLDLVDQETEQIVVSDDRRFLSLLSVRGIPFLTPADMLVLLAGRGIVTKAQARDALERLRPLIRVAAYYEARENLEDGGGP